MAERAPDAPRHSLAAWPCAMVMCSSMEGTHWGRRSVRGQLSFDIEAIAAAAFVLSLRERGLRDKAVLGAMERVPRDLFAPRRFADLSRRDVALPLSLGQTMTAPGSVAVMLTALQVRDGDHVLEIGSGSGYVSALLAKLGGACRRHRALRGPGRWCGAAVFRARPLPLDRAECPRRPLHADQRAL